ncbi:Probable salivary secreted peptide [Eumeta japonica]|uniref:Probable salivary secreted peptide n=1 Tax=Eumeta variegata TaxID=151549 RepID=A0A4C1ZCW0_EUMVA|nr:Probable salivary secreted peptide [Eumeta japonica]
MRSTACLLLLSVSTCVLCHNVFYGSRSSDMKLISRQKVEYNAIPWKKRVKFHTYEDPYRRAIRSILCYDYLHSEASVNITDGGLGSDHFTLRLKSQRSYGLDYAIEVYA